MLHLEQIRILLEAYMVGKHVPCKIEFRENADDSGAEVRAYTSLGVSPERIFYRRPCATPRTFYARARITEHELADAIRIDAFVGLLQRAADDAYGALCAELREFLRGA